MPFTISDVRPVDDADGVHYESIITAGQLIDLLENEHLRPSGNIRPDWRPGGREAPKTRKKILKWSGEFLGGRMKIGNLSVRLHPDADFSIETDEQGRDILVAEEGTYLDFGVDSQSRATAIKRAHEKQPQLFPYDQRIAVRVYIADDEKAAEIAAAYNTEGDRVNDSAAKFAHPADGPARLANYLVRSRSPHLGIDNIETLQNSVSKSSHKLVAFNTLVLAVREEWDTLPTTDAHIARMGEYILQCWDELAAIRPEFGLVDLKSRQRYRDTSMAGTALSLYGAVAVISRCFEDGLSPAAAAPIIARLGQQPAEATDWLDRTDARWQTEGILFPATKADGTTVMRQRNTFQTRARVARLFLERAGF